MSTIYALAILFPTILFAYLVLFQRWQQGIQGPDYDALAPVGGVTPAARALGSKGLEGANDLLDQLVLGAKIVEELHALTPYQPAVP